LLCERGNTKNKKTKPKKKKKKEKKNTHTDTPLNKTTKHGTSAVRNNAPERREEVL